MTESRAETMYLLERALRTRGFGVGVNGNTFTAYHLNGRFSLDLMPGNRRTLISHDSYINAVERGKGLGRKYLGYREEIAREAGINLMLATVRNDNAVEIHLLETSGWKRFTNRDIASLWGKEL